jgi:hypothetical protein
MPILYLFSGIDFLRIYGLRVIDILLIVVFTELFLFFIQIDKKTDFIFQNVSFGLR